MIWAPSSYLPHCARCARCLFYCHCCWSGFYNSHTCDYAHCGSCFLTCSCCMPADLSISQHLCVTPNCPVYELWWLFSLYSPISKGLLLSTTFFYDRSQICKLTAHLLFNFFFRLERLTFTVCSYISVSRWWCTIYWEHNSLHIYTYYFLPCGTLSTLQWMCPWQHSVSEYA